ncbi:interferon-induced protein 44-like, partial [Clarias magur]
SNMGSSQSKPEFNTVLADKQVEDGYNVILSCEAKEEGLEVSWVKDGQKLYCVEGKHKVKQIGKKCVLEISRIQESDEGKYTVTLSNSSGSESCSALVRVSIQEWRTVKWRQGEMLNALRTFNICDEVQELRFLLYGPVGTGKSSTINTIKTIFEGRQYVNCLAAAESTTSHTLCYECYRFVNEEGLFPFAFNDIMGVEGQGGVQNQDIISALKGHITEGYMFNSHAPLSENNRYYHQNPSLNDQMHCLVYVVSADKISMLDKDFITKLKFVRERASRMGIPQVVFMTKVDRTCPLTKDNLKNIYKSKKIRDKNLLQFWLINMLHVEPIFVFNFESFRFANEEESFPFIFYDIMGAEATEEGVRTPDVISALNGHIKEGYMFNSYAPLSKGNSYYNQNPSLSDQMHCLVYVVPADKVSVMEVDFLKKLESVRKTASSMGIPQVVFMTRVDRACQMTKENLQNIYKSKKIREN